MQRSSQAEPVAAKAVSRRTALLPHSAAVLPHSAAVLPHSAAVLPHSAAVLPHNVGMTDDDRDGFHRRLHHVTPAGLSVDTAQTPGMRRSAAIDATTVGSTALWMGQTEVAPDTRSANHHHGKSETGIYVVSGHPVFVFLDGDEERRVHAGPGDYVYVPPWVPHREENPDPQCEAVVVLARTTQEAIVVNLADLRWSGQS